MLEAVQAAVISYPQIDPVLVRIGPLAIRWYALAYLAGLLFGWWALRRMVKPAGLPVSPEQVDDHLLLATLGVVLGGRLGYVLFYYPSLYLADPVEIIRLWDGGMSFHGGLIGVVLATYWWTRRVRVPFFAFADLVATVAPLGLFLGRIANFINGELWGRPADVPWAMVFPRDPLGLPRHPSQLYEAALEGLVLFAVLQFLFWKRPAVRGRPGMLSGLFLTGYGVARFFVEFFREPDGFLGFVLGPFSMGQVLSSGMIVAGLAILLWARARPVREA
ncbi:MAG: prolipoprotein diacylglyceryl transferase [Rhodothalassiaceae bacterium]|nr:MAG: prolipoprotein diacylglyceryl transferase [Rhodothalassiaceae bacterium]